MRYTPLIAVPLIALSLAGCAAVQQEPPVATVAVEEQPVFASEEEALAAAQAAYTQYLAVSDQIARDGGANPERLEGLVSKALFIDEQSGFTEISKSGLHAIGSSYVDTLHLQKNGSGKVNTYLCVDRTQIRLFDDSGVDATSTSRIDRYPLEVSFTAKLGGGLLVESSDTWSGQNFC